MSKIISKSEKFNRKISDDWRLEYVQIPINGKKEGFFRFDWGENFKMWQEKDFVGYLKKLKGMNQ